MSKSNKKNAQVKGNVNANPQVVAERLSKEIIKNAQEGGNAQLLAELNPVKEVESTDYAALMVTKRPSAQFSAENDDVKIKTSDNETARFERVSALFGKQHSQQPMTHEVSRDAAVDIDAEVKELVNDEFTANVVDDLLNGDASRSNGVQRLRGILNARIDKSGNHAEALKADDVRDPEHYQAIKTGVSGSFGADYAAVRGFFRNLKKALPVKYRSRSKFYMNGETLADLEELESVGGNALVKYHDGEAMILGRPVVVIEQMPDEGSKAAPVIFGSLADAVKLLKLTNKEEAPSDHFIVDKTTAKGVDVIYLSSRYGEIMGNNDAIRVGLQAA